MNMPTEQELDEFIGALQLSIKTKINNYLCIGDTVVVTFEKKSDDESNLMKILTLFDSKWNANKTELTISGGNKINWSKLTLFLLITRMNEENIRKFISMDESAREIAGKLGLSFGSQISDIKRCSQIIFGRMQKKKMTIRELAESSGLTQVSISNFKIGKDIRLSNLLKIIKALGLCIKIE